jgi:hypothetical protein
MVSKQYYKKVAQAGERTQDRLGYYLFSQYYLAMLLFS